MSRLPTQWFALTFAELPLQVFSRAAPDCALLAVVEQRPRQRLVALGPAARALGVDVRGSVAGALAVAPQLLLRDRDPALEAAALHELACWAERFTPQLVIDAPDTLLLEVSASLRFFGGAEAMARAIAAGLAGLGWQAELALAPTPLAARWLARCRSGSLLAPQAGWQRRLDVLPIQVLADGTTLAPAVLELLEGIGARCLADLARLPRAGLARRQAAGVADILARACGERPDPRPWFVPPERFANRLVLPAPVVASEPLLFAAGRLFAGLGAWLERRQGGLDRCRLHLEHEDRPDTALDIVTGHPTRDPARFVMLAREHLAALELPAAVEAMRLEADALQKLAPHNGDLFGDGESRREDGVLLLQRLRARLGATAVHAVSPHAEHRPESAWRIAEPGRVERPAPHPGPARPAWLLDPPRALPSLHGLSLIRGPERIESGWWDGADVRRDYYVARTPDQALWWIFRRLDPPEDWYLHGYFG